MSRKKTSQKERVLKYISDFGSITPFEAFIDLGITKLATRISELVHKHHWVFDKEWVESRNRYGEKVRFMRYSNPRRTE